MVVCESGMSVSDVTYVPELKTDLLSVSEIVTKGHVVVFSNNGCDVYRSDEYEVQGSAVVKGVVESGVYTTKTASQDSALATTEDDQLMLGHLGK